MGKKAILIFLLLIVLLSARFIYSTIATYDYAIQKRTEIASKKYRDIHVAVVWDKNDKSFMDGISLALKEINEQGIMIKSNNTSKAQIVLHEYDDSTPQSAQQSSLDIANDHRIVAVIGHSTSASAIPASITYEYNGVLFISIVATAPILTDHGFKYTFSTIPTDNSFADKVIEYALQRKWYKLLVLHARNHYGRNMYNRFASQIRPPLEMVYSKSFFDEETDYRAIIFELMKKDFDAVLLGAMDENAAQMIKQLREMGMDKPILGGDGLDNKKIWGWSEHNANNMYASSIFVHDADFVKKFNLIEDQYTGYVVSQAYEALHILADAIQKTGSSDPILVASTLLYSYKQGYKGYAFDTKGLITNKELYIKEMKDGNFIKIE